MNLPIEINEHVIGITLKELVRRAINVIRQERLIFEATKKKGYGGDMDDVFTTADIKAQEVYRKSLTECFPGVGIVGEENLNIPSDFQGLYFTIDPLDGTRAFVRRQSHGISTMIALVMNGEVISAWIGDINTQEIFGYRPGGRTVHRMTDYNISESLSSIPRGGPLDEFCLLSRDLIRTPSKSHLHANSLFKQELVDGGSIGTWFARIWKGEVGGLLLSPGYETPWDQTPVLGISKQLGFAFLKPDNGRWEEYEPQVVSQVTKRDHQTLVVHRNHLFNLVHHN